MAEAASLSGKSINTISRWAYTSYFAVRLLFIHMDMTPPATSSCLVREISIALETGADVVARGFSAAGSCWKLNKPPGYPELSLRSIYLYCFISENFWSRLWIRKALKYLFLYPREWGKNMLRYSKKLEKVGLQENQDAQEYVSITQDSLGWLLWSPVLYPYLSWPGDITMGYQTVTQKWHERNWDIVCKVKYPMKMQYNNHPVTHCCH